MNCRLCNGPTELVLSLGDLPLVNQLLDYPTEPFARYPLDLHFCRACSLGQLAEVVAPEKMFEEYTYFTSVNSPMVEQATRLVQQVMGTLTASPALIVEIGSNDGYLLAGYPHDIPVLGIDPARGPANAAALVGVPTIQAFFTEALAKTLPKADVIHAHNVLAHVPDLNDFVRGIAAMLKPSGVVIIEVPGFCSLLERCEFDTIYQEHVYYFTFQSLKRLFGQYGLQVSRVESIKSHGGSMRLWLSRSVYTQRVRADRLDPTTLAEFASRAHSTAVQLNATLRLLRAEGKRVWGFGAAAKATVMLNYAGIDSSLIEKIADDTPAKQSKFIPGTGIQIASSSEWLAAQPDYTCIFAWNYADTICNRYASVYSGRFFTPYSLLGVEMSAST